MLCVLIFTKLSANNARARVSSIISFENGSFAAILCDQTCAQLTTVPRREALFAVRQTN